MLLNKSFKQQTILSRIIAPKIAVRNFAKRATNNKNNPMAGRFKPKHILNFNSKDRYLIYTSNYLRPVMSKFQTHPKIGSFVFFTILSSGCFLGLYYSVRLISRYGLWTHKYRLFFALFLTFQL